MTHQVFNFDDACYTLENRKNPHNKMPKGGGIYAIRHKASGKCYVGQTVVFSMRIYDHLRDLRRGRHGTPELQKAFTEYGESAFDFLILETKWEGFGPEQDKAERFWTRQMLSSHGVFNCEMEIKRALKQPKSILPLEAWELDLLKRAAPPYEVILQEDKAGFHEGETTYPRSGVMRLRRAGYLRPLRKIIPARFAYQTTSTGVELNVQTINEHGQVEE